MNRARPATPAVVLAARLAFAAWAGAGPAAAQEEPGSPPPPGMGPSLPERIGEVPGTWDLSRDGTTRRCVMTLAGEAGEAGRRLAFPAGCRRALPIVGGVAGWLFADGLVRLVDRNLRPVLLFARRPDQRSLVATVEGGETYSFVPLDIAAMRPPAPPDPEVPAPETETAETAAPEAPARGPPAPAPVRTAPLQTPPSLPADLQRAAPAASMPDEAAAPAGLYALDRFNLRDTCRVALDPAGGAARIVPGCRDGGMEVFDPVRWRYAGGRLTLTAKRGHTIDLVPSGDGRWRRDPEIGTTFVLRRVEP